MRPSIRLTDDTFARATRTPHGPATVVARVLADRFRVRAWGPGAEQALAAAEGLLGLTDAPEAFAPDHPTLRQLLRDHGPSAVRLPRVSSILESLVPIVLQQLVTFAEAATGWLRLLRQHGAPAPGPLPLLLFPDPGRLVRLPVHAWRVSGIGIKRAQTIVALCSRASRIEEIAQMSSDDARRRLRAFRGVGPWTTESFLALARGDPDAIATGDIHLPNTVAWGLAREPRADDARMLALLEPFRPHRSRVVKLLYHAGVTAPRRGPKRAVRHPSER